LHIFTLQKSFFRISGEAEPSILLIPGVKRSLNIVDRKLPLNFVNFGGSVHAPLLHYSTLEYIGVI